MMINQNNIIKHLQEIQGLQEYLPLVLYRYVGVEYIDKLEEKEKKKYYKARTDLQRTNDYNQFLQDDLQKWLKKHKQYQDIIE